MQGTVSGLVAVGVVDLVDLLEVVQIQHQCSHGQLVACGMCQQAAALGGEASPVEHAGEAIGHRQRAQLVFGLGSPCHQQGRSTQYQTHVGGYSRCQVDRVGRAKARVLVGEGPQACPAPI